MLAMVLLASAFAEKKQPEWEVEPFLRPEVGFSAWAGASGNTSTALNLGAQAGARYWQAQQEKPRLQGLGRARAVKVFGSGVSGTDVRVGNFIGPAWKHLILQTGPDVFWNEYQWGETELAPTLGLGWPVQATTGLGPLSVTGGVEPAWFLSSERPSVDWGEQDLPGIGDEMTYYAGVGANLASLRVNVSYQHTLTAFGAQKGFGVGVRVGG